MITKIYSITAILYNMQIRCITTNYNVGYTGFKAGIMYLRYDFHSKNQQKRFPLIEKYTSFHHLSLTITVLRE